MAREIKFRAWDSIVMVYQDFPKGGLTASEILKRFDNVMQFTGLKDKNGKEIYEGDVVRGYWDKNLTPMIVIWQAPSFVMKEKIKSKRWSTFDIVPNEPQLFEVIGNIYENSNFLKESSNGK